MNVLSEVIAAIILLYLMLLLQDQIFEELRIIFEDELVALEFVAP